MQPIFFGSSDRRLYGVHHSAEADRRRDVGVLLCYPAVQEYMRTHWAFRRLASLLAREGFHVLRFDYFGTGNSDGEPEEASPAEWCADIAQATQELCDLAAVDTVSVVGFRLGAALAATAATKMDVQDLVLWEPVVDGRQHVDELRQIEQWTREQSPNPPDIGADELLGYGFPPAIRSVIEEIDIRRLGPCRANRVHLYAEASRPEYVELGNLLHDRSGGSLQIEIVRENSRSRVDGVLMSTNILQRITATLSEAA